MQLSPVYAAVVSTHTAESAGKSIVASASALYSKRLAHDGAAASEDLQV
jgi:hypothetical protein